MKILLCERVVDFCPCYRIIPALIGAGVALGGAALNYYQQKKANEANISAQNANLDYQKAVQQQTWQREDTSWQRAVNDIQKTGMSPLALSGGAAAGQTVSTTATMSQAPQVDAGAFANSAANVSAAMQAQKQLKLQTEQMENTVKQQKIENGLKQLQFEQAKKEFDLNYSLNKSGQDERFKIDWSELARKVAADEASSSQFDKRLAHDDAVLAFQQKVADRDFTEKHRLNDSAIQLNSDKHRSNIFEEEFRDMYGFNPNWNGVSTGAGVFKKLLENAESYVSKQNIKKAKSSKVTKNSNGAGFHR